MISARTHLSRLSVATAICLIALAPAAAEPAPPPPPPAPAGPVPVPYPNPDPPTVPECPASLCPKAGGFAASIAQSDLPPDPRPFPCIPRLCPRPFPVSGGVLQLKSSPDGSVAAMEVESFSWGAGDGTTVATSDPEEGGEVVRGKPALSDMPVVKVKDKSSSTLASSDPEEGGEVTGPVYSSDPQEGGEIAGRKAGGGPLERTIRSPRDPATGLATGKRQHKPVAMERGSLFVTMPEGACVAGAHYPAVTLQAGGESYQLSDVTVASCTPVAAAKGKKDKAKLDYMIVTMESVLVTG